MADVMFESVRECFGCWLIVLVAQNQSHDLDVGLAG
jgi:hypothetical protein